MIGPINPTVYVELKHVMHVVSINFQSILMFEPALHKAGPIVQTPQAVVPTPENRDMPKEAPCKHASQGVMHLSMHENVLALGI